MKKRKTLEQKLRARHLGKPNVILYWILAIVIKVWNLIIHTHFTYRAHPSQEQGSFVLISNHASRADYLFTAPVCFPKRLNYVVGYNEFLRFPLNIVLRLMQAVPKKNFIPDTYSIREMMRIISEGGNICIMPEGMSSITGMAQPVIPGGAKLLKKLGVPVYYTKISGGYLTFTKHCLDQRAGRVDVTVDRMFTPEELNALSVEEIEDRMNRLLAHDDYIWNKREQVRFNCKGKPAYALDTLLYLCPKCGTMHEMTCTDKTMTCRHCGNTIAIDEKYNISPVGEDSVCPPLVTDWTILERERAAKDVRKEKFFFSEQVRVGLLPEYRPLTGDNTSVICGEGTLTLFTGGLRFIGTVRGEDKFFIIPSKALPTFGMCTDISRFYTFVDGEFIEFYPENGDALRWDHLVEEMHRYCGGKWQNTPYRHEE